MKEGVNMDCIINFIDGVIEVHHNVVCTRLTNDKAGIPTTLTITRNDNTRIHYLYDEIATVKFERR